MNGTTVKSNNNVPSPVLFFITPVSFFSLFLVCFAAVKYILILWFSCNEKGKSIAPLIFLRVFQINSVFNVKFYVILRYFTGISSGDLKKGSILVILKFQVDQIQIFRFGVKVHA